MEFGSECLRGAAVRVCDAVFLISDDTGLSMLCPQGLGGEPGLVPVHSRGLRLPVRPTHPDFDPRSAGNVSTIASRRLSVWVQPETCSLLVWSFRGFVHNDNKNVRHQTWTWVVFLLFCLLSIHRLLQTSPFITREVSLMTSSAGNQLICRLMGLTYCHCCHFCVCIPSV